MKFSIVIPVYNVAPYLHECLNSVIAQTYTDWEAICVDDGSTDGSDKILDEYAAMDSRIIVSHQNNAGVSVARNLGIGMVRGDYFLFLDADDVIAPWSLSMFLNTINDGNCDGIVVPGQWHRFSSRKELADLRTAFDAKFQSRRYTVSRCVDRLDLLCSDCAAIGCVCGRVFKTSKFVMQRFDQGVIIMEDLRAWARMLCVDAVWVQVEMPYYYYRSRHNSASHKISMAGILDVFTGHRTVVEVLNQAMRVNYKHWAGYWRHYRPFLCVAWRRVLLEWAEITEEQRCAVVSALLYCNQYSALQLPVSVKIMKNFVGASSFGFNVVMYYCDRMADIVSRKLIRKGC